MYINLLERNGNKNFWNELDRIQDELSHSFFRSGGMLTGNRYPAINLYQSTDEVVASILLPGYDPESISIQVEENKFSIKGTPSKEEVEEGYQYFRQEIGLKEFSRTIELPFRIAKEKVEANLKNGILVVKLPKAEADKPRKITVTSI
ncbi:MAG: Hsp20/alpha crystallin family protein [Leptospiraceae bacterium]|nr:Hsp20/alpha crystallin family protein [Leptospiraceae bacterium]MCP5513303.1 Hsp20/alpha crystallin family protein [Leptospiraceae bacterium]